jgi:hypothetical protein
MSEFLPLRVESYEGSVFNNRYSYTSMLEKRTTDKNNVYTSNYPEISFAFKSIDNRPMFVETVTIVSRTSKIKTISSIGSGLIFTANELSWFTIAKQKFTNYTK